LLRTAIFFFNRTCLSGKTPPGHYHALRTWVFELT
jgi:hypothetical protein